MCVVLECDKAICLNELGRMMSWYGDRVYSGTFFRKSLDIVLDMLKDDTLMKEDRMEYLHPQLVYTHKIFCVVCIIWSIQVQPSTYALMASAWDVG